MSAHNVLQELGGAVFEMLDPGDAGSIGPDRYGAVCPVVTAGAETRTLAAPLRAGIVATVVLETDGGDLTLTVTNGYNSDGDTSITLADAGDFVTFMSIQVGDMYYWRVLAHEGVNVAVEDFSADQLTATSLTLAGTAVSAGDMTPGTGISAGVGTICEHSVVKVGGLIKTSIFVDLTGLKSGGTAGDIIGKAAAANCHLGQILAAVNGEVIGGTITCLEVPAGGDPDIDLFGATASTGTQDAAVGSLTGQAILCNSGDHTIGSVKVLTAMPAANAYLYLACGDVTDVVYTAGKLLIELWGK